jgi:hypothetical protein
MLWMIYQIYVGSFNEKEMTIHHADEAIRTTTKGSGLMVTNSGPNLSGATSPLAQECLNGFQ